MIDRCRDRLKQRGALPVDEALGISRQIAGALLAAHGRNIVHRDVKPDNVLFQGETAMLTDFGIAKVLDATTELTGTGGNPGTVKYFSPEQATGQPVDQRSDIYALGVVLYEMLTGRAPVEGDIMVALIMGIAHQSPAPLPDAFKGLQPFLDVLLAKAPADRLGSCAEVIAIVQAMERNWMRYGEVDRLTDGIVITPSGQGPASVDQDDETRPRVVSAGPEPMAVGSDGSDPHQRTGPTIEPGRNAARRQRARTRAAGRLSNRREELRSQWCCESLYRPACA